MPAPISPAPSTAMFFVGRDGAPNLFFLHWVWEEEEEEEEEGRDQWMNKSTLQQWEGKDVQLDGLYIKSISVELMYIIHYTRHNRLQF